MFLQVSVTEYSLEARVERGELPVWQSVDWRMALVRGGFLFFEYIWEFPLSTALRASLPHPHRSHPKPQTCSASVYKPISQRRAFVEDKMPASSWPTPAARSICPAVISSSRILLPLQTSLSYRQLRDTVNVIVDFCSLGPCDPKILKLPRVIQIANTNMLSHSSR